MFQLNKSLNKNIETVVIIKFVVSDIFKISFIVFHNLLIISNIKIKQKNTK